MAYNAVIDTSFLIQKKIDFGNLNNGFITTSVYNEVKDSVTKEYLEVLFFKIFIRDPKQESILFVKNKIKNKHLNLSKTDLEVCALMKELAEEYSDIWISSENMGKVIDIVCLTTDNGIKSALKEMELYEDPKFKYREYKLRCYTCSTLFNEHIDFCTNCGYSTITRASVIKCGGNDVVCFKKGFKVKPKILKDKKGNEIRTEDSLEYKNYLVNKFYK